MKLPGLLMAALFSLSLFSCSRDADDDMLANNNTSIEGSWRMVAVKNNSTGFIHGKPRAITGDVDIMFLAVSPDKGFINGKTPTNTIFRNSNQYNLGEAGKISIPCLAITKVAETSWGLDFVYSITKSDNYSIEPGGRLRIHTAEKTLYFERN
jgi:hypothetical protein